MDGPGPSSSLFSSSSLSPLPLSFSSLLSSSPPEITVKVGTDPFPLEPQEACYYRVLQKMPVKKMDFSIGHFFCQLERPRIIRRPGFSLGGLEGVHFGFCSTPRFRHHIVSLSILFKHLGTHRNPRLYKT